MIGEQVPEDAAVSSKSSSESSSRPPSESSSSQAAHRADRSKRLGSVVVGRFGAFALAVVVVLCGLTLIAGFANKDRCTGPRYDAQGRSVPNYETRNRRDVCYSDIQFLWLGRDIDNHVFPYVHGGITPDGQLTGGSVEYPVLTGVLMWAGAYFAHNDGQFLLYSALLLAPFGLLASWLLGKLARWRALIFSLGPPIVLYAFHNWDLAAVCCTVLAVYLVHRGWGRAGAERPLLRRAVVGAVLLGVGCAFKLYPAMFVLPLMAYVATGGDGGRFLPPGKRYDVTGALKVALTSIGTVALVNLPFAVAGTEGWEASFEFQAQREVDSSTDSVWYWAFRPESDSDAFQHLVSVLSPTLVIASFALAMVLGWRRYRREGTFCWVAVSAAMLCGFLLLHKVNSPQYALWLLPFFVLLRIRFGWVLAYFAADLAIGIGIFRWYYAVATTHDYGIYNGFSAQAVVIGVYGRAALLVGLFVAFLYARSTIEDTSASRFLAPGVTARVRQARGAR